MSIPGRASLWSIDRSDVITYVGGNWDAFAIANDARSLCGTDVLGAPLFDFIAGEETRLIYRLLIGKARATNATVPVLFRCDSPELERYMRLEIVPGYANAIEFRSVLLRAETRPRFRALDLHETRSRSELASCSFCMRVELPSHEWLDAEAVVARTDLLRGGDSPRLVHGICPECDVRLHKQLGAESDPARN